MDYLEITNKVLINPHFSGIRDILSNLDINEDFFMREFTSAFHGLLDEHANDNKALKEESFYYILPAIAMYRTLKRFTSAPVSHFRAMWLQGAFAGAAYLQKRAQEDGFLEKWCQSITPKEENAGAFVFDIKHVSDIETEYHVLSCPYVRLCEAYGCPEIVTVFCDSDDISFGNIHPRLVWGRTKTIGRGDDVCDFKYTLTEE